MHSKHTWYFGHASLGAHKNAYSYSIDNKKKKQELRSHSNPTERRKQDRRQRQNDRRDPQARREWIRSDRRRGERRNPSAPSRDLLPFAESINLRKENPSATATSHDTLKLCVISTRAELIDRLRSNAKRSSAPRAYEYKFLTVEIPQGGLEEIPCDLILIDSIPSIDWAIQQLRIIRAAPLSVKIILMHGPHLPDLTREIIEYRIKGLLPGETPPELFEKAIQAVHRGELWLPHQLIGKIFAYYSDPKNCRPGLMANYPALTPGEQKIVALLAQGLSNKQIALQLSISPETVKKHMKNIFRKTGTHSRSELISHYVAQL